MTSPLNRPEFAKHAQAALETLENQLADLEHDDLDVDLASDVLTLAFTGGDTFILNAHSAAQQIWMAADRQAWHFDFDPSTDRWVAAKTGDELMETVSRVVGHRLGLDLQLR